MLARCYEKNLEVEKLDLIDFLRRSEAESISLITAFHVVEHLDFESLKVLIQESLRVLRPGGILVMETPNPENLVVGSSSFYLDPTHFRPLPPDLLAFIPKFLGFKRTKIMRLQEDPKLGFDGRQISLLSVLQGVSPDYSVLAQKEADYEYLQAFNPLFSKEYGLQLASVVDKYDGPIRKEIEILKLNNIELSVCVKELQRKIAIIWKVAAPIRWLIGFFKKVLP